MRVMGLDFGSKTVGVAISDPLFVTAQGIEIIRRKEENKLRHTLQRIEQRESAWRRRRNLRISWHAEPDFRWHLWMRD